MTRTLEGGGGLSPAATQQVYLCARGGLGPSTEEGAYLQGFIPVREHLLLQEVYGDFPRHNDRMQLTGGVLYNAVCKIHWRRIAAKSAS